MSDFYKVVLIGEANVGKTSIIAQFINNIFDEDYLASVSCQFSRKTISFEDNKSITFDIWDTAGQEKYRSLAKIFYKDAKAVILVYDITNKKSFEEMMSYWYKEVLDTNKNNMVYAVAANKSDLYEQQKVSDEEGEQFAKSINAIFMSTSAKNDSGIQVLFENIGRKILGIENYNDNGNKNISLNNQSNNNNNNESGGWWC